MTGKAKQAAPASSTAAPIVLFGIDGRGKCKGARFGKEHASLAIKAASQLDLRVLASDDPKVSEIAARLPVGRVHGNGRTFVPFIRQDLYDKLVAAAPNGNAQPVSPPERVLGYARSHVGRIAAQLAAELAGDRPRRSCRRPPEPRRRLVRGDCHGGHWRHAHVALA